ncbi:MAG: phage tail family protein [Bacilli bacterium]|nr:phage tail family protein [Bacilli bacterium]
MSYLIYNGISSESLGIRIQTKNIYSAPKYDANLTTIPGRNGDLISPNGRYANVTVSYTCYVPAKSIDELCDKLTKIKNWLYKEPDRYHDLTDSYDAKFKRRAVFNSKLDITDEALKIGVFTITFSCVPFRYLLSGLAKETHDSSFTLNNEFAFSSKPYIKVIGRGSGSLIINNKVWQFETLNGYTECDSELMNFYHDTTPKNDTVSGDGFPELQPGLNSISFEGGITSVEIIPRWVSL